MADYTEYAETAPEWMSYAQSFPRPKTTSLENKTVDQLRDIENFQRERLARASYQNSDDVHINEISIATSDGFAICVRLYRPKSVLSLSARLPLYIHLHGGGWHYGTLDTEEPYCRQLCSSLSNGTSPLEVAVLNVNYRHTPEFNFPSQIHDAWAAFDNFAREGDLSAKYHIDPEQIIVGGTSAGASLAIAIAIKEMRRLQREQDISGDKIKRRSRLRGLIISSSPTVHPDLFPFSLMRCKEISSYEQFQEAGILPTPRARHFFNMYVSEDDEGAKSSEFLSPLLIPNESMEGSLWPHTSVHVAGFDTFRDEGILFATKLQSLGIPTKLRIHRGYPHAFERFPALEESRRWREQVVEEIKCMLGQGNT